MLETLAQAQWMNRDRDGAVHSIQQAMSLIEPSPTRVRRVFEKALAGYRTKPLPAPCGLPSAYDQ